MENLRIPLYHGTSTLFLDGIMQEGLGKTNICEKYDLIQILRDLTEIAVNNIEEWGYNEWFLEDMVKQNTNSSTNWQHGQVYLSPSFNTAARYAKTNKYGSEIVSYIIRIYEDVKSHHLTYTLKNEFLLNAMKQENMPIVIKIENIPISSLSCEADAKVAEQIEYLDKCEDIELDAQQVNFRINRTISLNQFKIINL
jgi:hypothetical protein